MKEVRGPRRHFSKTQFNPYFQSHYYKNESAAGKLEQKILNSFLKAFKVFKHKKPNS